MVRREIIAVAVVIAILVVALAVINFESFSIVSVSQIDYDDDGQKWVATAVVNDSSEVFSFNQNYTTSRVSETINGVDYIAKSRIDVSLTQLQPSCEYPLFAQNYTFNIIGVPLGQLVFYELGNPQKEVPFSVDVYKYPSLDQGGGRQTLESNVVVDSASGTTVRLANDQVVLRNFGQLSGGVDCPQGNFYLIPDYDSSYNITSYRLATEASYLVWANNIEAFINNPLANFNLGISTIVDPNINQPSQFFGVTGFDDSQLPDKFVALMPFSVGSAFIGLEVDAGLADTFTYSLPNPIPVITSLTLDDSNPNQTETVKATVNVRNGGTDGQIELIPYNNIGYVNFSPTRDKIVVDAGQTASYTFDVYAGNSGTDNVCVKAIGVNNGEQDSECVAININNNPNVANTLPAPIVEPSPTPIDDTSVILPPPEPVDPVENCANQPINDPLIASYKPEYNLLGVFVGCKKQYNFFLIGIAVIITIVAVFGGIAYFNRGRN